MRSASSGVQTRPPLAPPAPGEDRRIGNGQDPPGGDPFAAGRWCDGRSRMSRRLVPPWRGRHCRGHAVHRAHGISRFPWPPPCSRSGRTGYACGPPTTPPTAIGRPPATAEGSESRAKDERGGLRRYRSRYRAVRSATGEPSGRRDAPQGSVGEPGTGGGWAEGSRRRVVRFMSATSEPAPSPPYTQKREFWVLTGYAAALGCSARSWLWCSWA
jgi:hypothetical protein